MEPVAPRIATPFISENRPRSDEIAEEEIAEGKGIEEGIEAIQGTTMAGKKDPGVLYARVALEERLGQIADLGSDRDEEPEAGRLDHVHLIGRESRQEVAIRYGDGHRADHRSEG